MLAHSKPKAFVGQNAHALVSSDSTKPKSKPRYIPTPITTPVSTTTEHNDFLSLFDKQPRALQMQSANPLDMAFAVVENSPPSSKTHVATFSARRDGRSSGSRLAQPEFHGSKPLAGFSAQQAVDSDPKSSNPTDDSSMTELVSRLQKSVVIKHMAVEAPNMISVPKGYQTTEGTKPVDYFKSRGNVKLHVKRKRDEGSLSKPIGRQSENQMYGFNPQEVNIRGAVSLENCQPSCLANDIHPLLARARFDDTPDAIYDQLMPALRLASMFLTQPACMQFWVTLALAERRDDPQTSQKYGRRCQRIDGHVQMTEENTMGVVKQLEDIAKLNLIHFTFRHRDKMPVRDVWACAAPIRSYRGDGGRDLTRSIIRLHADYYIVAEKLSKLKYPEQSQQLRFSFLFAVLILHELAHSIEGAFIKLRHYQWLEFQNSKQYFEPFFFDWERPPECGRTMEQILFGGEVHPINMRIDGSHGICISDWPPHGNCPDSERRVWYTVPMDYIEALFQKETWQQQHNPQNWQKFHIPRTGALSLYISTFTTMAWSEVERVANEEAAELLAISKAQPAVKKRLVFSGEHEEQRTDEKEVAEAVVEKIEVAKAKKSLAPLSSHTRRISSVVSSALPGAPPQTSQRSVSTPARIAEETSSSQEQSADESRPPAARIAEELSSFAESTSEEQSADDSKADDAVQSLLSISDRIPPHLSKEPPLTADNPPTSELVKQTAKRLHGIWEKHKQKKKLSAEKKKREALKKLDRKEKMEQNIIEVAIKGGLEEEKVLDTKE